MSSRSSDDSDSYSYTDEEIVETPLPALLDLADVAVDDPPVLEWRHPTVLDAVHSLEKTVLNHGRLLRRKYLRDKPPLRVTERQPEQANNPVVDTTGIDRVTVHIRVVFLKIGEIDTLKEQFTADAFLQARWREPHMDQRQDLNIDDIEWDKYWNPKVYIENSLGEPKETVWQTLVFNQKGEATVFERRRIKGCFLENMELNEFPFDTQDLTLTVTAERSEAELELIEDWAQLSSINVQSFVDEQEWRLHSHVETWRRTSEHMYHNSKYKHPAISASCRAARRPGFFIWNIFLVMLFICSLAFSTFTVDLENPQNRLQLSFILLLTTITFKFVVSQNLPRIPYLTYMDKYILTSMFILCTVCMWHSIVPLLTYNKSLSATADRCALVVIWTTYLLFHICFILYISVVAMRKRWVYSEKDRMHKVRMKRQQIAEEAEEDAARNHARSPGTSSV